MPMTLADHAMAWEPTERERLLSRLMLFFPPILVTIDADWHYALAGDQAVGRDHTWEVRGDRFVATGEWVESGVFDDGAPWETREPYSVDERLERVKFCRNFTLVEAQAMDDETLRSAMERIEAAWLALGGLA